MLSIMNSSVFGPKNPLKKPYVIAMHGISPAIPDYQEQRLNNFGQFLLGDDGVHVLQELLPASLFPVFLETGIRKRILPHRTLLLVMVLPIMYQHWN